MMNSAPAFWGYDVIHVQSVLMVVLALIVFAAYQMIPTDYERIAKHPGGAVKFLDIMRSLTGRSFIRWCGIDHVIMGVIMASIWVGVISGTDMVRWFLIASEGVVAIVSVLSAVAIRREARG